jgi:membrane glycosyltransferase
MSLVPKVAGWIDVALTPGGVARYGGTWRFIAGAVVETVFSILLAPAAALQVTIFLIGLLGFGRSVIWGGQQRDAHKLSWAQAAGGLWPQTLFGLGLGTMVLIGAPGALPWSAPVLLGLVFAIPFAALTAHPRLGAALTRAGLCAIPDERAPAPELLAVFEGLSPAAPAAGSARAA